MQCKEQEEVTKMVSSPAVVYRYVRDDATGRSYKRMFLKDDPSKELVPQLVIVPVSMLVPSEVGSAGQRHHKHRAVPVKAASTRPLPYGGRQGAPSHQHSQHLSRPHSQLLSEVTVLCKMKNKVKCPILFNLQEVVQ